MYWYVRIRLLGFQQTVYAILSQFITGIGSWDSGICLWASGDQTLLGIELHMQFWVNSLQGFIHGIRDFASGHPGSTVYVVSG